MNRTGRTIVLSAVVVLVLGTDWALEKAFSNYQLQDGAGVSEPAPPSEQVASPLACEPSDMPAASDSSQANDLRSQG
jgi:hypothetical protein